MRANHGAAAQSAAVTQSQVPPHRAPAGLTQDMPGGLQSQAPLGPLRLSSDQRSQLYKDIELSDQYKERYQKNYETHGRKGMKAFQQKEPTFQMAINAIQYGGQQQTLQYPSQQAAGFTSVSNTAQYGQQQQFQQPQFQPTLGVTIAPQWSRTFAEEPRQAGPIGIRRLPDNEAVRPHANPVPQGSFNTAGSYNDQSIYGQLGGDGGKMEYTDEDWGEYGDAFIGQGYNPNAQSHQGRERKSKHSRDNRMPRKNDRNACQDIKDRRGQLSSSSGSTSLESLNAEMEATSITGKNKKPF